MRLADKVLVSLTLTVLLGSSAFAATITGKVQGPDGKPFMGAFVVAENTQNKMTVSVLSDQQGRYHIGNLAVRLRAAKKARALERFEHVSGPAAFAQDQEPRPHLSGSFFHDLLPVLPLVSKAHGFRQRG